jgi:RNA polymerase sigma-70 factor (ECF subfamily)
MKDIFEKSRERRLAARMAQGETKAFEEFVGKYGEALHRLARANAYTLADAEDLTQEIMIAIARGIDGFRGESSLKTWTTRIALNLCIKHRERRPQQAAPLDEISNLHDKSDGPARLAEHSELCEHLDGALGKLTDDHREVVLLHEIQGLTYAECAEVLKIPIGTVKSRLSNAFRSLRKSLNSYVLGDDKSLTLDLPGCANSIAAETEV